MGTYAYTPTHMLLKSVVESALSAGLVLQVFLAVALVVKKAWRKFPVFTAYALLNLVESVVLYTLFRQREAYFYSYVLGETITLALGLGVVYEIFTHLFSLYPALRGVARLSLYVVVVLLIFLAGAVLYSHAAIGKSSVLQAVLLVEEAARVLEVGLIAYLFIFSSLFGLHWRQSVFGITLGLGIFATAKLLVLVTASQMGPVVARAFSVAHVLAFDCSLLIWMGYILLSERVASAAELPKRAQLEQWNQAIMELINQ